VFKSRFRQRARAVTSSLQSNKGRGGKSCLEIRSIGCTAPRSQLAFTVISWHSCVPYSLWNRKCRRIIHQRSLARRRAFGSRLGESEADSIYLTVSECPINTRRVSLFNVFCRAHREPCPQPVARYFRSAVRDACRGASAARSLARGALSFIRVLRKTLMNKFAIMPEPPHIHAMQNTRPVRARGNHE